MCFLCIFLQWFFKYIFGKMNPPGAKEGLKLKERSGYGSTSRSSLLGASWDDFLTHEKPDERYGIVKELALQRSKMNSFSLSPESQPPGPTAVAVSSLEDHVAGLAREAEARAIHLTASLDEPEAGSPDVSRACVAALRANWRWIYQMMQCAEVHLRNAAAYHLFFFELGEAEKLLEALPSQLFKSASKFSDGADSSEMESYIRNMIIVFSQWQVKVEYIYDQAKCVVPVPDRVKGSKTIKTVTALTDFRSGEIEFSEGESLTLLDSTDSKQWKVRKSGLNPEGESSVDQGSEGTVPANALLLPPPCMDALGAALTLRLKLMVAWTEAVKRAGFRLIAFMGLVLRDWTDEEVDAFHTLSETEKCVVVRILFFIEGELGRYWKGYGDFETLQEKLHRLQIILLEESYQESKPKSGKDQDEVSDEFKKTIAQIKSLDGLMKSYMELWYGWEVFVSVTMLMRQPDYMLFCDKWEQLRFTRTSKIARFWDSDHWGTDEVDSKTDITKSKDSICMTAPPQPAKRQQSLEVTVEEKKHSSSTDVLTSDMEQDVIKYVIKSVYDPRDRSTVLSMQEAIVQGVIDQINNTYVNPTTGVSKPIPDAMSDGDLIIEIIDLKKIREEHKSYGIIKIKVSKQQHPYTVLGVTDPQTGQLLGAREAQARNILDLEKGTYRSGSGQTLSLKDAIAAGHVQAEDHPAHADPTTQDLEKTYAVHGVLDLKKKEKLSFAAAVRAGLLDKEAGMYVNTVTGDRVPVFDAILRGYIKARPVADPSKLPFDPENSIVVDRFRKAEKKILAEIKVINAFKSSHKK